MPPLSVEEIQERKKRWGDLKEAPLNAEGIPIAISGVDVGRGVDADDPRLFDENRIHPIFAKGISAWPDKPKLPTIPFDSTTSAYVKERRFDTIAKKLRHELKRRMEHYKETEFKTSEDAMVAATLDLFEEIVLHPGEGIRARDRLLALKMIGETAQFFQPEGKGIVVVNNNAPDSPFANLGNDVLDLLREALLEKQRQSAQVIDAIEPPKNV